MVRLLPVGFLFVACAAACAPQVVRRLPPSTDPIEAATTSPLTWDFASCTPSCSFGGSAAEARQRLFLADVAFQAALYETAVLEHENAVCLDSKVKDGWWLLGTSYLYGARHDEAICAYRQCIRVDGSNKDCTFGIEHVMKLDASRPGPLPE